MTNFIPLFPLRIVVYPGETLNLHIFEPRYIQMVNDCLEKKKGFGLLPVLEEQQELGTYVEILELVATHGDGSLDIRTQGTEIFRILTPINDIPDKLYNGAIVNYPPNTVAYQDDKLARLIVTEVKRLYELLNLSEKYLIGDEEVLSYQIAHLVGLSLDQEYELLGLFTELHRLEYIRRHLNNIVPVVKELETMKERIKRNGHFRNLSLN